MENPRQFLLLFLGLALINAQKLVGTVYYTHHSPLTWYCGWGKPSDGQYESTNRIVMQDHAEWLRDAGVDFVLVDWSDNIQYNDQNDWMGDPGPRYLEQNTVTLFEVFSKVKGSPKIGIMIGSPIDQTNYKNWTLMGQKLDQIHNWFVKKFKNQYFFYQGKPFVLDYVGTPSPFQTGLPPWNDDSFTVRHITGFLSEQPNLRTGDFSKFGYWSLEDRQVQTHTNEAITVGAAWRGEPCGWGCVENRMGRRNGKTFTERWENARQKNVDIVLIPSFNHWKGCPGVPLENLDKEFSTDIEPSKEWGTLFLDITKAQSILFKQGL